MVNASECETKQVTSPSLLIPRALLIDDILRMIFAILPWMFIPTPHGVAIDHMWHYSMRLVCRRWRDIADGCAPFWVRVPLDNAEIAILAVNKSGVLPLFVVDTGIHKVSFLALEALLPHTARIEELRMPLFYNVPARVTLRPTQDDLLLVQRFFTASNCE